MKNIILGFLGFHESGHFLTDCKASPVDNMVEYVNGYLLGVGLN